MTESISIIWTRHDIEEVAQDRLGKSLLPKSASVVLKYLQDNYDANVGINWDVVEAAIREVRDKKSIVLNQIILDQIGNGSMERWFLGTAGKLNILDLDENTKQLAAQLKYGDNLGILVSLPNTTGYTELKLTTKPIANLVYKNSERNHRLKIERVVNLVLTEFNDRIFPNVKQLQELLLEASKQLCDRSEAVVTL